MRITWMGVSAVVGTLVGLFALIAGGYNTAVWFDSRYIDVNEAQTLVDKQTSVLEIMNDNIVNIGTAIYDRKLAEIDQWIKDLEARHDRNAAEDAFLQSLRESRKEVLAAKDKLNKVKIGP